MKFSKDIHSVLLLIFMLFLAASSVRAADEEWLTDYKAALQQAEKENKMLLMDFTGSDWCGWCIKLDKEVFSKSEFKDYAKKNLVLLKLDFPRSKPQTAEIKKQNEELSRTFRIGGYPTIIVLDSKGKQIGQLGYKEGGPAVFLAELDKFKKN